MNQSSDLPARKPLVTLLPCRLVTWLGAIIVFLSAFSLYIATLAPGSVPGDPSEYIFVPYILGIAHPPGYAFYTLTAKLWQTVVRVGTIAYRTNLFAAFAGAVVVMLVYGIVLQISDAKAQRFLEPPKNQEHKESDGGILASCASLRFSSSLFAAFSAMASADLWQHAIHSNAHIVTAALATLCLFLLTRWWRIDNDRWLAAAAFVAGLSLAHHPILAFSFPAYGIFVSLVKPRIVIQPRKLAGLAGCFALGLAPFLYYVLRGPSAPFNTLPTLASMLIHVTARGLTVNLFPFGLRDQPTRFIVFCELLRLQYPLLTIVLAALGAAWLVIRRSKLLALFGIFFLVNLAFTINTIQDVLAYLMPPFVAVAVMAGVGLLVLLEIVAQIPLRREDTRKWIPIAVAVLSLAVPISTAAHNLPRISLRDDRTGDEWVNGVFDQFAGKRQHAVLLAEWEALTPLWVAQHTQGRALDPADVKLVYIAAISPNPWLDGVFAHWNEGPVYLADFRREVWEGGAFRLRPEGRWPLWRVVAPGDTQVPSVPPVPLNIAAENKIELLSYSLDPTRLRPGDTAHLTLAMRAPVTLTNYVMPFALVGDRQYRWTTDSRSIPPWSPGEVIVERYDVTIPFDTPPGAYPVQLGVADPSQERDLAFSSGGTLITLGTLTIEPARGVVPPQAVLNSALANFDSEIALMGATGRVGSQSARAIWTQPLVARPGQDVEIWLDWRALEQTETSYKVFVHLIQNDQLAAPPADYYTPLGGAFPTALWIPVWIEGQTVSDPHRLTLPATLAPGEYAVEIGLYDLFSKRRAPLFDHAGSLAGDRVILGPVSVR
jgi:Protein O-mannosyl-transferase TMEM260-like